MKKYILQIKPTLHNNEYNLYVEKIEKDHYITSHRILKALEFETYEEAKKQANNDIIIKEIEYK